MKKILLKPIKKKSSKHTTLKWNVLKIPWTHGTSWSQSTTNTNGMHEYKNTNLVWDCGM